MQFNKSSRKKQPQKLQSSSETSSFNPQENPSATSSLPSLPSSARLPQTNSHRDKEINESYKVEMLEGEMLYLEPDDLRYRNASTESNINPNNSFIDVKSSMTVRTNAPHTSITPSKSNIVQDKNITLTKKVTISTVTQSKERVRRPVTITIGEKEKELEYKIRTLNARMNPQLYQNIPQQTSQLYQTYTNVTETPGNIFLEQPMTITDRQNDLSDVNKSNRTPVQINMPQNSSVSTVVVSNVPQNTNSNPHTNSTTTPTKQKASQNLSGAEIKKILRKITERYDPKTGSTTGSLVSKSQKIIPSDPNDLFNDRHRVLQKMNKLSTILLSKNRNNELYNTYLNRPNSLGSKEERKTFDKKTLYNTITNNRKQNFVFSPQNRFLYLSLAMISSKGPNCEDRIILRKMRYDKGGVVDLAQDTAKKKDQFRIRKFKRKNIVTASPPKNIFHPKYRDSAARIIQAWWRDLKERYQRVLKKIILIQSCWRGKWVRKYIYEIIYLQYLYLRFSDILKGVFHKHVQPVVWEKLFGKNRIARNAIAKLLKNKNERYNALRIKAYLNRWNSLMQKDGEYKIHLARRKIMNDIDDKMRKRKLLMQRMEEWKLKTKLHNEQLKSKIMLLDMYYNDKKNSVLKDCLYKIDKYGMEQMYRNLLMKYLAVVNDDRNKKNELKFNKWKLLKNKNDINALGNISKGANILDKQAMKLPREAFRKIHSSTLNQTNAKPQFDDYRGNVIKIITNHLNKPRNSVDGCFRKWKSQKKDYKPLKYILKQKINNDNRNNNKLLRNAVSKWKEQIPQLKNKETNLNKRNNNLKNALLRLAHLNSDCRKAYLRKWLQRAYSNKYDNNARIIQEFIRDKLHDIISRKAKDDLKKVFRTVLYKRINDALTQARKGNKTNRNKKLCDTLEKILVRKPFNKLINGLRWISRVGSLKNIIPKLKQKLRDRTLPKYLQQWKENTWDDKINKVTSLQNWYRNRLANKNIKEKHRANEILANLIMRLLQDKEMKMNQLLHRWNKNAKLEKLNEGARKIQSAWRGNRVRSNLKPKQDNVRDGDKMKTWINKIKNILIMKRLVNAGKVKSFKNAFVKSKLRYVLNKYKNFRRINALSKLLNSLDSKNTLSTLEKAFDIWRNKVKDLNKRNNNLDKLFININKRSTTVHSKYFMSRLIQLLTKHKENFNNLRSKLISSKENLDSQNKPKLVDKIYKIFVYKILDKLFNKCQDELDKNLKPLAAKKLLNRLKPQTIPDEETYEYKDSHSRTAKPKTTPLSFHKKTSNPKIPPTSSQEVSSLKRLLLPYFASYLNSKLLQRKQLAFNKLKEGDIAEKFCDLYKRHTFKTLLKPKRDLINALKNSNKKLIRGNAIALILSKFLKKRFLKHVFKTMQTSTVQLKIISLLKLLLAHKLIARNRFILEVIRKWRFMAFMKNMSKRKLELMYKNVHCSYIEMANDMFGDEDEFNPSMMKEFERFGSGVGVFTCDDIDEDGDMKRKYYEIMTKKYNFKPIVVEEDMKEELIQMEMEFEENEKKREMEFQKSARRKYGKK